ncbi:MAG: Uracil-DNA glycosylase [uncultured bacterium (gcode 4)]|uniref:Uracil-DNA glycosylase n=1 Tax=uncultured bacterium (gcode 4) TaxID=1234023 RepID=K1YB89_9BACT|nr:MAG: Uracil-DNA glycosylase [uncultured bacterium (gcode 4)]
MSVKIHPSWKLVLANEFEKPYWQELISFIEGEYSKNICFPKRENIFRAFDITPFDVVKVVILGQDPYHTPGAAMGMCFSVPDGSKTQPSLQNIFKELGSDVGITRYNKSKTTQKRWDLYEKWSYLAPLVGQLKWGIRDGTMDEEAELWVQRSSFSEVSTDLTDWAEQGVLLLNSVLTVRSHEAASHHGVWWEIFTDEVIRLLSEKREHLVFILWGNYAISKKHLIDEWKHLIITSPHPSPFSAYKGFFGSRPFSRANEYLRKWGIKGIEW